MRACPIAIWVCCLSALAVSTALSQESTPAAAADQEIQPTVPLTGSQLPPESNRCSMCHTEAALWDESNQRLFIPLEIVEGDAHWQKGVVCSDCHGGEPASTNFAEAHASMVPLAEVRSRCAVCHHDQRLALVKGVHAKAGEKDERGRGLPMDCGKCHGPNPHEILPSKSQRSPVYLNNQVNTCGACHQEDLETYKMTVHGTGLYESGLTVTAVCTDCHGSHGMYYAADRRSMLHPSKVAATCSECHHFIEDRLAKSVHGGGGGLGAPTSQPAMGGKIKRHPTCTDCHQGHHVLRADQAEFRLELASSCGNCHADLASGYALSMHGKLTSQGHTPAAECADCHGAHDILPVNDPNSKLAPGAKRLQTCQKCHLYAVSNFTSFDPHADFKDEARYPTLHSIYWGIRLVVNIIFILFLLHAILWFVRAMVDRLQHGGHATLGHNEFVLPRFDAFDRYTFVALATSFVGLTATGLTLRYSNHPWGQRLAQFLGGFHSASVWHHFFAVIATLVFFIHLARAMARLSKSHNMRNWKSMLWGPDSLFPNSKDIRDLGRMLLWFIGFGPKPGFERWAYWEKLDYWAFFLAALLIGISGMMMWYPNLFCLVLPGAVLNVAKLVHSEFAIYIASFIFLIHYFHAHFRPEKFPMDLSVLTGMVSERHLRKYRPAYVARLEKEGRLGELREQAPSERNVWLNIFGGTLIFALGFGLLSITILASLGE